MDSVLSRLFTTCAAVEVTNSCHLITITNTFLNKQTSISQFQLFFHFVLFCFVLFSASSYPSNYQGRSMTSKAFKAIKHVFNHSQHLGGLTSQFLHVKCWHSPCCTEDPALLLTKSLNKGKPEQLFARSPKPNSPPNWTVQKQISLTITNCNSTSIMTVWFLERQCTLWFVHMLQLVPTPALSHGTILSAYANCSS